MNGQGFRKTSSPKFDGAAGQRAGVRLGVEDPEPVLQRVVDRAAGAQLDDQVGRLAQRVDGVAQRPRSRRRAVSASRMCTWTRRRRRPRSARGLDQLVERDRQRRDVGLGGLGAGGGDGDQGARRRHAAVSGCQGRPRAGRGRRRALLVARPRRSPPGSAREPVRVRPRIQRGGALDQGQRDRTELVVPRDRRQVADGAPPSTTSAPRSGRTCPEPSRCRNTSRRGGRPRLCTRATVSCPR